MRASSFSHEPRGREPPDPWRVARAPGASVRGSGVFGHSGVTALEDGEERGRTEVTHVARPVDEEARGAADAAAHPAHEVPADAFEEAVLGEVPGETPHVEVQ